ncbi:cupin domain-containing protein [Tsukamurella serpentis]
MIVHQPEVVGADPGTERGPAVALFADATSTGGAASVQRVHLPPGSDGAAPHLHRRSTEIFYVLGGELEMLIGDYIATVAVGGLAVIEPNVVHAFAATTGEPATALIVLTPGVERFGYFRLLRDIASGAAAPADLLDAQDMYDNHFVDSPLWRDRRRV